MTSTATAFSCSRAAFTAWPSGVLTSGTSVAPKQFENDIILKIKLACYLARRPICTILLQIYCTKINTNEAKSYQAI